MSSSDEVVSETPETDEPREALLAEVAAVLGGALVETHLVPGHDPWVRVTAEAWVDSIEALKDRLGFGFFDFLSAIDWLPSPFGRSEDAIEDVVLGADDDDFEPEPMTWGYAGGASRFQILLRIANVTNAGLSSHKGLIVKADVGDDLTVGTLASVYPGAIWHEREAAEMFGLNFSDHPGLTNLYLPSGFEGFPLRKDFPLVARLVKPWPGIVDVEAMPEDEPTQDAATPTPEAAS